LLKLLDTFVNKCYIIGMVRRKYPSELNTTLIRVYKEDCSKLRTLSEQHDTTVAEVVHQLLNKEGESDTVDMEKRK
jgi:hypothetical protein